MKRAGTRNMRFFTWPYHQPINKGKLYHQTLRSIEVIFTTNKLISNFYHVHQPINNGNLNHQLIDKGNVYQPINLKDNFTTNRLLRVTVPTADQ